MSESLVPCMSKSGQSTSCTTSIGFFTMRAIRDTASHTIKLVKKNSNRERGKNRRKKKNKNEFCWGRRERSKVLVKGLRKGAKPLHGHRGVGFSKEERFRHQGRQT